MYLHIDTNHIILLSYTVNIITRCVYILRFYIIFKNQLIICVSLPVSIRVVFKWLMKGFSGHLLPEQLLNLWDMVIAYDSLEVLPLLAVAILSFRKDNLLQVNTLQNVEVCIQLRLG